MLVNTLSTVSSIASKETKISASAYPGKYDEMSTQYHADPWQQSLEQVVALKSPRMARVSQPSHTLKELRHRW